MRKLKKNVENEEEEAEEEVKQKRNENPVERFHWRWIEKKLLGNETIRRFDWGSTRLQNWSEKLLAWKMKVSKLGFAIKLFLLFIHYISDYTKFHKDRRKYLLCVVSVHWFVHSFGFLVNIRIRELHNVFLQNHLSVQRRSQENKYTEAHMQTHMTKYQNMPYQNGGHRSENKFLRWTNPISSSSRRFLMRTVLAHTHTHSLSSFYLSFTWIEDFFLLLVCLVVCFELVATGSASLWYEW